MSKPKEPDSVIELLRTTGPQPRSETGIVKIPDRRGGVKKFALGGKRGATKPMRLSGKEQSIYYLEQHDKREVIKRWLEVNNPDAADEVLYQKIAMNIPRFKEAAKDVLDPDFEARITAAKNQKNTNNGRGGVCPLCGEEYESTLATHLTYCDSG